MRRRLSLLAVAGFWLVMMGSLVVRWLEERRLARLPGTYRSVLTRGRRNTQQRMGIYWRGERVGFTQTLFYYREDGKHDIQNHTEVEVPIPGLPRSAAFKLDTSALVGGDHKLENVRLRLESEVLRAECQGFVEEGRLTLYPRLNGRREDPIELKLPPGQVLAQGFSPLVALPPLREGMRWSIPVLDPFTLAPSEVEMHVIGTEELRWQKQRVRTHVVDIRSGFWMRARAWVSPEGDVLKQKTVFGLTFVREPVPDEDEGEGTGAGDQAPSEA